MNMVTTQQDNQASTMTQKEPRDWDEAEGLSLTKVYNTTYTEDSAVLPVAGKLKPEPLTAART